MHKSEWPWFIALAIAAVVVCLYFGKSAPTRPFAYDEADYMYAGTRGLIANYLDRPSIGLVTFIRKGLELRSDPSQRGSMSQFVRSSGDINFYRHYHGPMYAYWIALCTLAGVHSEAGYRTSGLILHVISTSLIFWLFRLAFPSLPPISAFIAALTFLLNRTALVTSTTVTQHLMFTLFAGTTLFLMAMYARTLDPRYWYATMASLAFAVCSVETSFILAAAIVVSLLIAANQLGWKRLLALFARGLGVFALAVLVVWPKGWLQLSLPKGYLYLAYMAVNRKTFSPISPAALWGQRLRVYPLEFVPAALALAATILWLRKYHHRKETIPFLIYACLFSAVTMVITLPYTHYYGSLLLTCSVLVGIGFGELWMRVKTATRAGLTVVTIAVLTGMAVDYYRETIGPPAVPDLSGVLSYLSAAPADNATWYVPFNLIPMLHYYRPDLKSIGYDVDWTPNAIAVALLKEQDSALFCAESTCAAVRKELSPPVQFDMRQVTSTSEAGEPLYAARLGRP